MAFNAVDAFLALLIAVSVLAGWRRGFIASGAALAALVASLAAALLAYRAPAAWLADLVPGLAAWSGPLAFLFIFLVGHLVLAAWAGALVSAVQPRTHGSLPNKVLGTLPGAASGLLNAAVVSLLLLAVPLTDAVSRRARDSILANTLGEQAEWLESRIAPIFDPAIRQTLQTRMIVPGTDATVKLPFRVASPRARPELEARMLELVNAERARHGLPPLRPDPELVEVAREHSRDMLARGYFSHHTPEGGNPFDRMRQADVRFHTAGENLALAPTLQLAHQGLMNSPGHRANILRPAFGRAGIGVLDAGVHGLMVTQKFRN